MTTRRPAILSLAVFATTVLVFARLTTCSFTWWDDQETIHQNPRLNPPTWNTLAYYWSTAGEHETMGLFVPVTYTVWTALAKIGRLNQPDADGMLLSAAVFHTANILIHALTSVAVFLLLAKLFENSMAAFCGSLLFAVHPVQVETVAWVSGTKDLLCGLFSVCSLLLYVRWLRLDPKPPRHRWRYLAAMAFFILAMLSKPTAVVVPLMAVVIAIILLRQKIRPAIFSLLPWIVLMIPCVILTQRVQPSSDTLFVPPWLRPAVAADAVAFYLFKLVWPMRLCIDYGRVPNAVIDSHWIYFTWIVPAFLVGLLWHRHKNHRPAVAAGLLFVLPILPVLGLVPFEFQVHSTTADHYLYLPMLGVALLFAWAIARYRILVLPVIGLLIGLATRSVIQEATWQDTHTLMNNSLAVNPQNVDAMDILGFVSGRDARRLLGAGKPAEARLHFDQSIDWYRRSLELDPGSGPSLLNLALNYQAIDRQDLWQGHIRSMTKLPPDPMLLAKALVQRGDARAAIAWLDELIRRDSNDYAAFDARKRLVEHMTMPANH